METANRSSRLAAILGETIINKAADELRHIELDLISCNPNQPRRHFDQDRLNELAQSIKQHGVLQPIILQELEDGTYTIIAGERRWRACRLAGLATIPAVIKFPNEKKDSDVFALIENLQRQNLSPLEEAFNYAKFIEEYNYTQEELSQIVGKSRSHIANLLRLNSLPNAVKEYLEQQKLSLSHAKLLAGRGDAIELAQMIVEKDLNTRQTEKLLQGDAQRKKTQTKKKEKSDDEEEIGRIEQTLSEKLGFPVQIDKNKGRVVIGFSSLLDLDLIVQKLDSI